ncbi:hypothetical protein ACL7TT_09925 [Microbulbifer sp. 2304DJ12-6]|uniref:hypothetical protein n=1 Tax=Microbulbifer sp. 2304DJ12-6 TaxID=3233340 RepID=UPI0039B03341
MDFSDPQLQMALFGETLSPAVSQEMSRLFIEDFGLNHTYGYVNQNPLSGVDPLGLVCMSTMCPRVPKFPKDLLPHKKKIEQCLKGKGDRDDIPKDVREKAADYYQRAADALHRQSSASNKAKNLNQASESPRVSRRLTFLRELANEQTTWILSRSTGTRSSHGVDRRART